MTKLLCGSFSLLLLLFASSGAAVAQVPGAAFTCTASAGVPPILRAEGRAELSGDIVVYCTGGAPTQAGATVPTANISIF